MNPRQGKYLLYHGHLFKLSYLVVISLIPPLILIIYLSSSGRNLVELVIHHGRNLFGRIQAIALLSEIKLVCTASTVDSTNPSSFRKQSFANVIT